MTIDERLEFLLQSTESLHATAALQSDRLDKESYRVDKQSERLDKVIHAMELMEHFCDQGTPTGTVVDTSGGAIAHPFNCLRRKKD